LASQGFSVPSEGCISTPPSSSVAKESEEIDMHWLWTIIIGLVVGAVAKLLMPGKDPGGFIITMLLGIAGSLVGTWLGRMVGWYQEGESAGFIMSVIGAIILLAIYHFVRRRKT
jgi:uncharacterized membrane protein YeaQ/YmgE (transglycosylase-associated protein family)